MTSIIEKRRNLHSRLASTQKQNTNMQLQVSQLQALANIGTTTCMIAHEINNLLTPLASYADLALANADDKALSEKTLRKTAKNCRRATKIMESILAVANGQSGARQNCQLLVLVEEIFSCLCRDFSRDSIGVKIQIDRELTVWAVPIEIQQVLMNLILNARDAMLAKGGTLTITAEEKDSCVRIVVSDTGCGIEHENLPRIFELFFTTKKDPAEISGSGLGLAFCKKVIDACHGEITVKSTPKEGTSFIITLPKPR